MHSIFNGTAVSMTLVVGLSVCGCSLSNDDEPIGRATTGGSTTGGVTSRGGIGGNGIDGNNTFGGTGDMGDAVDSNMGF